MVFMKKFIRKIGRRVLYGNVACRYAAKRPRKSEFRGIPKGALFKKITKKTHFIFLKCIKNLFLVIFKNKINYKF